MYNKTIYLYDDQIGKVEYVEHMGSDLTAVNSARVSFGVHKTELDDKDKKLIQYLINHKHTSTLEHNIVTLRFKVPLYVRSQHHRHRTWSYNEISRRYTDSGIEFYEPKEFRTQHKSNRQASNSEGLINPLIFQNSCEEDYTIYTSEAVKQHHRNSLALFETLLEVGVCREQARGVLPQNLYTEYYGTVNANNLFKFISLRLHEGAQWEIVKVAEACLEIAYDLWPEITSAFIKASSNNFMEDYFLKKS
jgi:thymidylate synthase (FAD)